MNVRETSMRVKEKLDPRAGRKFAPTLVDHELSLRMGERGHKKFTSSNLTEAHER